MDYVLTTFWQHMKEKQPIKQVVIMFKLRKILFHFVTANVILGHLSK